jgi:hypothetical protein
MDWKVGAYRIGLERKQPDERGMKTGKMDSSGGWRNRTAQINSFDNKHFRHFMRNITYPLP